MRTMVFVDFDGTLFDSRLFLLEILRIFQEARKINQKEKKISKIFPVTRFGTYFLEKHLYMLSTKNQRKKVKRGLRELFDRSHEFLFEDAKWFLLNLKQQPSFSAVLITRGESKYQARKIYQSLSLSVYNMKIKWNELFDRIDIVEDFAKAHRIREIIEEYKKCEAILDRVFFIDDNIEELRNAKAVEPFITTIQINRFNGFGQQYFVDHQVSNLLEALKIIHAG